MIVDINSAVSLRWNAGTDLGTVAVVVTDPLGAPHTISGGAVSGPPLGVYTASHTPTVGGRHTVTWTSATRVFNDVFEVRPAAFNALISVQDAKDHLRLTANNRISDDTIQGFIEAASIAIQNITGPIVPQSFNEYYDGGVEAISVDYKPIIKGSVQMIEYYGTTAWNLTEQPLGGQQSAYGFTVDYVTGQIRRRTFGGGSALFAVGSKNVNITYRAGRDYVGQNIQTATKELVRHLWSSTQVPGRPKSSSLGDDGFGWVPIGFAVPNFVVQLLQNDARPPGVA